MKNRAHIDGKNGSFIQKASLIIYSVEPGPDGRDQIRVLAPFTEGSFSDGHKAYGIIKGDVEEGSRDLFDAAARAFKKEIGIDLYYLLSNKYEGVKLISCDYDNPFHKATVQSYARTPQELHLFAVKVDTVKPLADHIRRRPLFKRYGNTDEHRFIPRKAQANTLAKELKLPSPDELLQVMWTGIVPKSMDKHNMRAEDVELLPKPILSTVYDFIFTTMLAKRPGEPLSKISELDQLWQTFAGKRILGALGDQFVTLQKYLNEKDIVAPEIGVQLGVKNRPLRYFQQSADILTLDQYLDRMHDFAKINPLYRLATYDQRYFDKSSKTMKGCDSIADVIVEAGMKLIEREKGLRKSTARQEPETQVSDIALEVVKHTREKDVLSRDINRRSPDYSANMKNNEIAVASR